MYEKLKYNFNYCLFLKYGRRANAVPHYQKLCARVSHVWGDRTLQPSRVQGMGLHMEEPPT